jgi:hypothetical protein
VANDRRSSGGRKASALDVQALSQAPVAHLRRSSERVTRPPSENYIRLGQPATTLSGGEAQPAQRAPTPAGRPGPPGQVAAVAGSHTGRFLKRLVKPAGTGKRRRAGAKVAAAA